MCSVTISFLNKRMHNCILCTWGWRSVENVPSKGVVPATGRRSCLSLVSQRVHALASPAVPLFWGGVSTWGWSPSLLRPEALSATRTAAWEGRVPQTSSASPAPAHGSEPQLGEATWAAHRTLGLGRG